LGSEVPVSKRTFCASEVIEKRYQNPLHAPYTPSACILEVMQKSQGSVIVRNAIFGVEDALVSTVGLLSGIAIQGVAHGTVLLTGLVYIFVEGFSMAVGSFLAEESAEEYEAGSAVSNRKPFLGAVAMFVSSVIAGFVPVVPYLLLSGTATETASIVLSIVFLGVLGFVHARIAKLSVWPRVIRMVILGGGAIVVGVVVGALVG
jgi:VIT1/CCC1 family predicted Fe2+/Mn2+ transporter